MAQAEVHEIVSVDRDKLFRAITRYEDYPKFVEGVEKISVERKEAGRALVTYRVNMMKELNYTLDIREDAETGVVEWKLEKSDSFTVNNGRWELKAMGPGKTDVKYSLELEFNFPVPGFILNRLIKSQLPSMVKSFAKQADTLA